MTQEEKELLLKDLCGRLSYGVICTDNRHGDSRVFKVDAEDERVYYTDFDEWGPIKNCKSYLRPMSSMTETEKAKYDSFSAATAHRKVWLNRIDWLLSKHFDIRGLIPLGLALEAPEGMYNN